MFALSEVETAAAVKFTEKHQTRYSFDGNGLGQPINGHHSVTYSFTGGPIGQTVVLTCSCGARENVTDYDAW